MPRKNRYPKKRTSRLSDLGAKEHYEREQQYIKNYRKLLDTGKWVVIGCDDHVYVNRIWPGPKQVIDAALQGFWPDGTVIANKITGQIVKITSNGKGSEIKITEPDNLTNIQGRRYRDYVSNAKK